VSVLDAIQHPAFQQRFFFLAKRFVAGERVEDAIEAVAALNAQGISATLDFLGEDVTSPLEADRTRDAYLELLATLRARALDANVSLKLTAIGLAIDEELAYRNLREILRAAEPQRDPFVRIDMESSRVTDVTLRLFERAFGESPNVGPVLQAYLKRTPADVERTIALGARVRLVKGAYNEPRTIAYKDMPTIRGAFLRCAEALLERGRYPAIATHDEALIDAVRTFSGTHGIGKERFEFQLLYGVRPDLQRLLVGQGYRVRVYVPYGTHWAAYFYRRIMERRENLWFALRSLLSR
jgi:proline dehydrogenase